jgi:hypothetical protein
METTETLSTMDGMAIRHAGIITLSLAALDVSEATDHPALQAIIQRAVADTPQGELVFGITVLGGTLYIKEHQPWL